MPLVPLPCQVAACLLLFLEEDDAFWMMCAIIEDLLPASYFSTTLLGVQVPIMKIPVKPGRNLAVIIEVAAMNNRQKKLGFNSAQEFTERINRHFAESMKENGNG